MTTPSQQEFYQMLMTVQDGTASQQQLDRWEQLLAPYVAEEIEGGIRRNGDLSDWRRLVQQLREYLAMRRMEIAATINLVDPAGSFERASD